MVIMEEILVMEPMVSSKEFITSFITINKYVKDQTWLHRKGKGGCLLCRWECFDPEDKDTRWKNHNEWSCPIYKSPKDIRNHMTEARLCRACGFPALSHNETECSPTIILRANRGNECRRCGEVDHIFWTCDGRKHPGSQFKINKKVDLTKPKIGKCTQHNAKESEQICKKEIKNDPTEITKMKNENMNKPQASKTSIELTPSGIDDKLVELESRFESNLDKRIESVMSELKILKESVLVKNKLHDGKCQSDKDTVVDQNGKSQNDKDTVVSQNTKNIIKNLITKLSGKNDLIKSQKDEIEKLKINKTKLINNLSNEGQNWIQNISHLEEALSIRDEKLSQSEKLNKRYEKDMQDLIDLFKKLFPSMIDHKPWKDIDNNLDNSKVISILEMLIEQSKKDTLENKREIGKIKEELSIEKKNIKEKENNIDGLEDQVKRLQNYVTEYESRNIESQKTIKIMGDNLKRQQKSSEKYETQVNSFRCLIKEIKTDLEDKKLKIEDSQKQVNLLQNENRQLKEKIETLEYSDEWIDINSETSSIKSLKISEETSIKGEEFKESAQEPYKNELQEDMCSRGNDSKEHDENYPDENDENSPDEYYLDKHDQQNDSEDSGVSDHNENEEFPEENEKAEKYNSLQEGDLNQYDECAETLEDIIEMEKTNWAAFREVLAIDDQRVKRTIGEIIDSIDEDDHQEMYENGDGYSMYENLIYYGYIINDDHLQKVDECDDEISSEIINDIIHMEKTNPDEFYKLLFTYGMGEKMMIKDIIQDIEDRNVDKLGLCYMYMREHEKGWYETLRHFGYIK